MAVWSPWSLLLWEGKWGRPTLRALKALPIQGETQELRKGRAHEASSLGSLESQAGAKRHRILGRRVEVQGASVSMRHELFCGPGKLKLKLVGPLVLLDVLVKQ